MSSFKFKNHDAIVEELAEAIMNFDKERNTNYETDVYMYIENGSAKLSFFQNVGGNSWIPDEHFTIYTDKWGDGDLFSQIDDSERFISDALEMATDEVRAETAKYFESDIEEIDISDIEKWAEENYSQKLTDCFNEFYIDEYRAEYLERAENIICDFEESYEEN